jgi:hypothetical protein
MMVNTKNKNTSAARLLTCIELLGKSFTFFAELNARKQRSINVGLRLEIVIFFVRASRSFGES